MDRKSEEEASLFVRDEQSRRVATPRRVVGKLLMRSHARLIVLAPNLSVRDNLRSWYCS